MQISKISAKGEKSTRGMDGPKPKLMTHSVVETSSSSWNSVGDDIIESSGKSVEILLCPHIVSVDSKWPGNPPSPSHYFPSAISPHLPGFSLFQCSSTDCDNLQNHELSSDCPLTCDQVPCCNTENIPGEEETKRFCKGIKDSVFSNNFQSNLWIWNQIFNRFVQFACLSQPPSSERKRKMRGNLNATTSSVIAASVSHY